MVKMGDDYKELLQKEQRRRKIKIFRHLLGMIIMIAFSIYIIYFSPGTTLWIILLFGSLIYASFELFRMFNQIRTFISLDDELHYEDGEIVKYNARQQKSKKWIPLESVEEVYLEVEGKPNLLFVVYIEDDIKRAESFYKQRIKGREEFMNDIEENSLLIKEPITFEELKEKVEGS